MKRILATSALFALSLAFTGCQFFQGQPEPTDTEAEVTESTTATVNIVDETVGESATSTGTLVIEDEAMSNEERMMNDEMIEDFSNIDPENIPEPPKVTIDILNDDERSVTQVDATYGPDDCLMYNDICYVKSTNPDHKDAYVPREDVMMEDEA